MTPEERTANGKRAAEAGALLLRNGFAAESIRFLRRALRADPLNVAAVNNLSVAVRLMDRFPASRNYAMRALEIDPGCAPAWNSLGMVSEDLGDFPTASEAYAKAVSLAPEDHRLMVNYATALMREERFTEAWPLWDAGRLNSSWAPPAEGFPVWDGTQNLLGKRILVIREGGYGDVFMFARWFPTLAELGAEAVFGTWPETLPLFKNCPHLTDAVDLREVEFEGLHYCVPLGGLASAFGMRGVRDIPLPFNPQIDENLLLDWSELVGNALPPSYKKRVGLCWRAGEAVVARPHRSIPESALELLSDLPGVKWFSLCPPRKGIQWAPAWTVDLMGHVRDWGDTAALLLNLDLVVTVDTAVAHLAATLGVPTWILVPMRSDWKWFLKGETSPWYPNVRLFRQQHASDWRPVLRQVAHGLTKNYGGSGAHE